MEQPVQAMKELGNSSADISRRNVEIGMEFQKVVYKFMDIGFPPKTIGHLTLVLLNTSSNF